MSEFFVGYLPVPPGIKRHSRRVIVAMFVVAVALAAALVFAQQPFERSSFDFLNARVYEGTLEELPYPTLVVADAEGKPVRYLLAAPGKHGAAPLVQGFEGKHVRLEGKLIERAEGKMIEVVPGSVIAASGSGPAIEPLEDLGETKLTGEVVDTKCFLGVMNPGRGKVHRDCAARCISGGLPAALLVRDLAGDSKLYLLFGTSGKPLSRELLPYSGQSVQLKGRLYRRGETLLLQTSTE